MSTNPGVDEILARQHLRDLGVAHHPTSSNDDWWTALYPDDDPEPIGTDKAEPPPGRFRKLTGRLTAWDKREGADLPGFDPEESQGDEDADPEWEEERGPDESTPAAVKRSKNSPGRRVQASYASLNPRTRAVIYSATAAATGYWAFDLRAPLNLALDSATGSPTGTIALILAAAGAAAAWRIAGRTAGWLPVAPVSRLILTAAGAWAAAAGAPQLAALASAHGIPLGPAGLVLGAATVCAVPWLIADRFTRRWWPPLAWVCRIPLASAVLAAALYRTH